MSDEVKIEVGSQWVRVDCRDSVARIVAKYEDDGESFVVLRWGNDAAEHSVIWREWDLVRETEPYVCEPKVGEVWRWKDTGKEFEIAVGPRKSSRWLDDFAVWHNDSGFSALSAKTIRKFCEYVRQGPL